MSIKLFVDDERPCPKGWIPAFNYDEAIASLRWENVEELSLDHDLGNGPTGYDIIKVLEEWYHDGGQWREKVPKIVSCHSSNPVGRKRIETVIEILKLLRKEKE